MVSGHNFKEITIEDARIFGGMRQVFRIILRSFIDFFR